MAILVAFEKSGTVREAFRRLGFETYSCDLQASDDDSIHHIQGDVFDLLDGEWDLIVAHPPCTRLTVTGNKWYKPEYRHRFPNIIEEREEAVELFMRVATLSCPRVCIENPVGIMSTRWRKPEQIIQPYQFGHKEPKKTCLWLKGLPPLQHTKLVEPEYHTCKSGKRMPTWYAYADKKDRTNVRSKTFQGIADAMANQWGRVLLNEELKDLF